MKVTEEVITFTEAALAQGAYKGDIKRALLRNWGIKPRTAENVLARARDRLLVRSGKSPAEHKSEAFLFYDATKRNPKASIRERLHAQECICRLLGLEAPSRQNVEITQPDGFAIDDLGLPLEMRRQLLEAIRTKKLDQQGKVMELPSAPAEPAAESAKDSTS
jgi:hypothetical protein